MMSTFNKFACRLPLALMAAFCQFSASAAIQTFNSESSFTPNLQDGYFLNNFTGAGTGNPLPFSQGSFSYTIATVGGIGAGVTGIPTDFEMSSVSQGGALSTVGRSFNMVITFTGGSPTALGGNFFWTDASDTPKVITGTVRAELTGGDFVNIESTGPGSSGTVGFGGFTTDGTAFTSLTISLVGYTSGDFFFPTVDNFYVGNVTPVPEAGTWIAGAFIGLFVVGRTGWGILRRRLARQ